MNNDNDLKSVDSGNWFHALSKLCTSPMTSTVSQHAAVSWRTCTSCDWLILWAFFHLYPPTKLTYKILLDSRIYTCCCRTTSVNPRRHYGQHLGLFYTYHELKLSTAVASSVSLHQLYGAVCLLTLPNTASLTAFRNRLKTFLFHHTPSGCSADWFNRQVTLNLRTWWCYIN